VDTGPAFPDLFNALFSWGGPEQGASEGSWRPAVEVLESETAWLLSMELPGVESEAVTVKFADGNLTVSGEKSEPEFAEGVERRRSELVRGKFERVFELPDHVEAEGIQARFSQGVLNVEIPKGNPGPEGRVIPITE